MSQYLVQAAAALSLVLVLVVVAVQPVAAVHETIECGNHPELDPLLQLLHDVTSILFRIGVAVGIASLAYAGIMISWAGPDSKQRAIVRVKRVLIGIVVLLMSPILVTFLGSYFPGCSGGV